MNVISFNKTRIRVKLVVTMSWIVNWFLFTPPEPSSYTKKDRRIRWINREIPFYLVRYENADFNIIYSQGNATDIGISIEYMRDLSRIVRANILIYDYEGYGAHEGTPSEKTCFDTLRIVFDYARTRLEWDESSIVLLGRSMGSGPSIQIALERPAIASVILISPIRSVLGVVSEFLENSTYDVFVNVKKIGRLPMPVYIAHGDNDFVVNFHHGKSLSKLCKNEKSSFLLLSGAGHNDVFDGETASILYNGIHSFLSFLHA